MGRKKQTASMGKALIKDRFRGKPQARGRDNSFLHTTELNDGYEGMLTNLTSVTEQSSIDDFLLRAELAGRNFAAEKENVQLVVTPEMNSGILSEEKLRKVKESQDLHKDLLRIPRRPAWNESTPADKLRQDENETFLNWRRQLARLQEDEENIVITPYEKNLEFWRQLWRVIERSDVVVQIVDARNPLLFWCPDLDMYAREVDPNKRTLVLINKADLLTQAQRQAWAEFFSSQGVHVVFWSAMDEAARLEEEKNASEDEHSNSDVTKDDNSTADESEDGDDDDSNVDKDNECDDDENDEKNCDETAAATDKDNKPSDDEACDDDDDEDWEDDDGSDGYETIGESIDGDGDEKDEAKEAECGDSAQIPKSVAECGDSAQIPKSVEGQLQGSDELLTLFRRTAATNHTEGVTTVGMVGYPNVGKSSTINAILQNKKVPVSATPGRTKHFQTLFVEKDLMLCDCPGLVFPSFVNSKAELVVNGILPIDQLMDSEPPVELVCHRVGRCALEALYHMNLPPAEDWEDEDDAPSAYDLLQAYASLRGFMSHKGNPDRARAARVILKDFVNGKLLYTHPPPGIESKVFQRPPYADPLLVRPAAKAGPKKTTTQKQVDALDQDFFTQVAHAQVPTHVPV